MESRQGTVISLARWVDAGRERSVLYQGYMSEMFVPYMDADYGWYSRTYFDMGEYGLGLLASPLKPDIDCPSYAVFLNATLNDTSGEPFERPNSICIFERATGEPV
jgi:primary-amine oxidase